MKHSSLLEGRQACSTLSQIGHTLCLASALLLLGSQKSFAQQWIGPNDRFGIIWRSGQVGIGTSTPGTKLEVAGDLLVSMNHNRGKLQLFKEATPGVNYASHAIGTEAYYNTYGPGIYYANSIGHKFYVSGYTNNIAAQIGFGGAGTPSNRLNSAFYGDVGIGTNAPEAKLHVNGDLLLDRGRFLRFKDAAGVNQLTLWRDNTNNNMLMWNANDIVFGTGPITFNNIRLSISATGNVGIGTATPTHKLTVNGTVRAKEIIVDNGWADFVFAKGYDLRSLQDVEAFIQTNGHLPDLPSEQDVKANGIGLGEMQTKLLQKIEELTLYVIALEKKLTE